LKVIHWNSIFARYCDNRFERLC